jgi:hypothetical protein
MRLLVASSLVAFGSAAFCTAATDVMCVPAIPVEYYTPTAAPTPGPTTATPGPTATPTATPTRGECNCYAGPNHVLLGTSAGFAILAKSGISSTLVGSTVTGDIGVSPIAATAMTGFSLTADSSNVFATSAQIAGKAFASNYAVPSPSTTSTAVSDMETAYADAAGRSVSSAEFSNVPATVPGDISGMTLVPGVYIWDTTVHFSQDITLEGGPEDTYIFVTSGDVLVKADVVLGDVLPENVVWQTAGDVTLDAGKHMFGVILAKTAVTMKKGSFLNGRILTQTRANLDDTTIF